MSLVSTKPSLALARSCGAVGLFVTPYQVGEVHVTGQHKALPGFGQILRGSTAVCHTIPGRAVVHQVVLQVHRPANIVMQEDPYEY